MRQRRVSEFMTARVVTLRPETTAREAERIFAEHRIGGAPVVDEKGRVLGVVSQSDLVCLEAKSTTAKDFGAFYSDTEEFADLAQTRVERHATPVEKLMSRKVLAVKGDTEITRAARTMRKRRVHRLLVVEDGVLLGVVSSLDLLRALDPES